MLAVAGGKGGCGKTTTTLGLAAALARQRKSVFAADADREMPDLHAMAGVSRRPGLDAVGEGWPPALVAGTATVAGLPPSLAVLPAASGPATADSPADPPATALARLAGATEAVLLDGPAGAGPDAVAPLRVAEAALVVTTPEPACLRDTAKTAAMARELGTPVAGAVVSRATENNFDGVADLLDCSVLGVVPEVESDAGAKTGTATSAHDPLTDDRVRAAHDRLVSALQPKYL